MTMLKNRLILKMMKLVQLDVSIKPSNRKNRFDVLLHCPQLFNLYFILFVLTNVYLEIYSRFSLVGCFFFNHSNRNYALNFLHQTPLMVMKKSENNHSSAIKSHHLLGLEIWLHCLKITVDIYTQVLNDTFHTPNDYTLLIVF